MLKGVTPRRYQVNIANSILRNGNTLVVLPTGLGKTLIALMVMDRILEKGGRALFLAPTRPLVKQHYSTILNLLDIDKEDVALITGEIQPKKRAVLWKKKVIVSTPQTAKNDMIKGVFDGNVDLCIIDEAHRAVGNYAYTFVAKRCHDHDALIIGLTASPGGKRSRIDEIMEKLFINNIEIRTEHDPDVAPYVHRINIKWKFVTLPDEIKQVDELLKKELKKTAETLSVLGVSTRRLSKGTLAKLKEKIDKVNGGARYALMSAYAVTFNLVHLIELLETQGPGPFLKYLRKIKTESRSKGVQRLVSRLEAAGVERLLEGTVHPKMYELLKVVKERKNKTVIVFAQYRDQIDEIVRMLNENGIAAKRFVGKRKGVTQKEQMRILEEFRKGKFNVIVASSIGEEGLDIPSVDTVVFYEPIPSEIRTIQRRGRAGRAKTGEVIILITKGTQDEAFYWASRTREKKMYRYVKGMTPKNTVGRPVPLSDANKTSGVEHDKKDDGLKDKRSGKEKTGGQTKITEFIG